VAYLLFYVHGTYPRGVPSIIIILVLLWFYYDMEGGTPWTSEDDGAQLHNLKQCSKSVQLFAYKVYFTIQMS